MWLFLTFLLSCHSSLQTCLKSSLSQLIIHLSVFCFLNVISVSVGSIISSSAPLCPSISLNRSPWDFSFYLLVHPFFPTLIFFSSLSLEEASHFSSSYCNPFILTPLSPSCPSLCHVSPLPPLLPFPSHLLLPLLHFPSPPVSISFSSPSYPPIYPLSLSNLLCQCAKSVYVCVLRHGLRKKPQTKGSWNCSVPPPHKHSQPCIHTLVP